MKICFYCDSIFTYGGVQRVLAVVAAALSEKNDVTILTIDPKELENKSLYGMDKGNIHFKYITYNKLPLYEFLPCKFYSWLYKTILPKTKLITKCYEYTSFPNSHRQKLIKEINESNYDIVVGVHVFLAFQIAGIKRSIKARTVGWLHNSYDGFFSGANAYIKGQQKRFSYQMPLLDKVVVLSKNDKAKFLNELKVNTVTIYNPLTLVPIGKGSPAYKKFLAVGRLVPLMKGFDILINAFSEFAKINKEWKLDIVGEGPEESALRLLITKKQLQNRVIIHPFTLDIGKHYSQASVYVLSSRWEGLPLVLLEAMQYHLPIIASRISITEELIENRGFSVMFENENVSDLAEKMFFMANKANLEEMGEKAFEYAKGFRLEVIIEKWEKLFNEISC